MREYPSPCDSCKRVSCDGLSCNPWRIRYLYRQKQINGYAKKHGVKPTPPEQKPALVNPCDRCVNGDDCRYICEARAKYWDAGMERLRKQVRV